MQVRTRKMPPQPHPPCDKRRLAESAHRSTIGRLPSGARPTQSGASRTAGSAYGGGISRPAHSVSAELWEALRRRTAGYRSPVRRKARHPLAGYGATRLGLNTALKRLATVPSAPAAPRRPCLLRLVSPPPRPALRAQQAQEVLRAEGRESFQGTPADPFIPQGLSVIERSYRAGSGGGLPVLGDARNEPR